MVKNLPANAGDAGSTAGLGRFPWRRKWQPTQVFLPGKSQDRGAWWSSVHGVTKGSDMISWKTTIYNHYSKRSIFHSQETMKCCIRYQLWETLCSQTLVSTKPQPPTRSSVHMSHLWVTRNSSSVSLGIVSGQCGDLKMLRNGWTYWVVRLEAFRHKGLAEGRWVDLEGTVINSQSCAPLPSST